MAVGYEEKQPETRGSRETGDEGGVNDPHPWHLKASGTRDATLVCYAKLVSTIINLNNKKTT